MRSNGLSRYRPHNIYRPTSLYSRSRGNIYQRLAGKTESTASAKKTSQTHGVYKSGYTGSLKAAISAVTTSASDLSRAVSGSITDREKAYSAARDFVDDYNNMYSAVSSSRSSAVSGRASAMADTARVYGRTLEKAGITVEKDGSLSLDKDKFMEADGKALSSALGRGSAFTGAAVSQAVNLSRYAEYESSALTGFGGYNSMDLFGSGSYTSALSGYLFNKLF